MIYNILNIADIHFGAVKPKQLVYELELIDTFIEQYHENLHLVVINGDYWDSKLGLYSKSSIEGIQWLSRLIRSCIGYNIKVIAYRGTYSHDDDQLEAFREIEKDSKGYFHIYNENTLIDIFEDLRILILPDENMGNTEYLEKYQDHYITEKDIDIGFFHGNFDFMMKSFLTQDSEISSLNFLVFEYEFWNQIIRGPLIAGHWHTYQKYGHCYYVSSFSRWCYNEEEDKGALFLSYDTEDGSYYTKRIINPRAWEYNTVVLNTSFYREIEDCNRLVESVKASLKEKEERNIRIKIIITDDKPDNDVFIQSIKDTFVNNKRVKITIKNAIEKEMKKKKHKKESEEINRFAFTMDNDLKLSQKLQRFISEKYNYEIPIDIIEKSIEKYLKTK